MNNFTFIQKIRNKIKLDKTTKVTLGKDVKIVGCNIYSNGKNNIISIKNNTVIRNTAIEIVGDDCHLNIGKNCMIGDNCYLSIKESTILSIGDNCTLSRNAKLMTSDGHPIYQNNIRINNAQNINIKNLVWIADNVTILKNVTIGQESIVGINSTLTRSIPEKCIAAGNPAKVVKENIRRNS